MERQEEETEKPTKPKAKAVIVGGSVAGLSCAHALISAGWDVVVVEKSSAPPTGTPTGAGLGLGPSARKQIGAWLGRAQRLHDATLPLAVDQNNATDGEKKVSRVLTRDEEFNFRAAHWTELHGLLRKELPPSVVLWGHVFLSFSLSDNKAEVKVKTKVLKTNDTIEITGNLLVAADGCLSSIRQSFLPDLKLRYSGYCAWRGVLDFSGRENSEAILGIKKAYPDLGKCLYFDLGLGTHSVLYELLNKRLNWIWYINQPEPELKGNSVTMKVSSEMIQEMHREAEKVWLPELARIMKETKEPFINVIYDCDPLEQIFWDNVVLVGDAAHPTTPHGLRSTNMSISDAAVLGLCLKKWGLENLHSALCEYQSLRLPVISKQVLHSRQLGRIKQGLPVVGWERFDPMTSGREECLELQQRNMPFFDEAPLPEDSSI
ncbi:6-hydroxynicotinate 3-monooxygenase-like [Eucalyptus grandis]|uniref:6-hydroxynicotinate 3-monooxygenase-like n=1 Tax=Eucalyptus grandis TaxID=71139 RepID=UPI00192EA9F3|nr:6-hydroxynicotinate 3-monooxygenase-like [Eucalyptus grandis]